MICKKHFTLLTKKQLSLFFIISFVHFSAFSQDSSSVIFRGTTILFAVSPDSILIAADSKRVPEYGRNGKSINAKPLYPYCKIGIVDSIIFSFSGLLSVDEPDNPSKEIFNPAKMAFRILKNFRNFDSSMLQLTDSINKKFNEWFKGIDSARSMKLLQMNPVLSMVSGRFINGKPFYKMGDFFIRGDTRDRFHLEYSNMISDTTSFVYPIGFKSEIIKYTVDNPGFYSRILENIESKLTPMIMLEVNANPDFVGKPIDIIKAKKNTLIWVTKNQECF